MKRLAPLLLLLGLAPPAQAVPVTGYVFGRITEDLSEPPGVPRVFAIGEAVSARFTYDLDPPDQPPDVDMINITWDVRTTGGYRDAVDFSSITVVALDTGLDSLRVFSAADPWSYDLRLVGGVGTFEFAAEVPGMGSWGFRAAVERTDTFQPVAAVPEPSTMALSLVGAALAAGWRRWT